MACKLGQPCSTRLTLICLRPGLMSYIEVNSRASSGDLAEGVDGAGGAAGGLGRRGRTRGKEVGWATAVSVGILAGANSGGVDRAPAH
jgi:hypothetical protein